jgi:hypothetical protein
LIIREKKRRREEEKKRSSRRRVYASELNSAVLPFDICESRAATNDTTIGRLFEKE